MPKASAVFESDAVALPLLSAYQKQVEKEMLSQEICEEVQEEEPIVLTKKTLRAKMDGIVMDTKVNLDELSSVDEDSLFNDAYSGKEEEPELLIRNTLRAKLGEMLVTRRLDSDESLGLEEEEEQKEEVPECRLDTPPRETEN